jgi:hypothetical protein
MSSLSQFVAEVLQRFGHGGVGPPVGVEGEPDFARAELLDERQDRLPGRCPADRDRGDLRAQASRHVGLQRPLGHADDRAGGGHAHRDVRIGPAAPQPEVLRPIRLEPADLGRDDPSSGVAHGDQDARPVLEADDARRRGVLGQQPGAVGVTWDLQEGLVGVVTPRLREQQGGLPPQAPVLVPLDHLGREAALEQVLAMFLRQRRLSQQALVGPVAEATVLFAQLLFLLGPAGCGRVLPLAEQVRPVQSSGFEDRAGLAPGVAVKQDTPLLPDADRQARGVVPVRRASRRPAA